MLDENLNSEQRLSRVENEIKHLTASVDSISSGMRKLSDQFSSSGKTNYSLIISLIGLIFVCTGSVGGLLTFMGRISLEPVYAKIDAIGETLDDHTHHPLYHENVASRFNEIAVMRGEIKYINSRLQDMAESD